MKFWTCAAAVTIASALTLPAATNTTATAMPWCSADSLRASTSGPISPGQSYWMFFDLLLTNVSQQTCMLQGYPGVDLVGPDDPSFGSSISVPRDPGDVGVQPVVLAPGDAAASLVGVLLKVGPNGPVPGWRPTTLVVTPPDSTTQLQTPWPSYEDYTVQPAGDQTAANTKLHPLTYYGPMN